jgi:hypothetical protein
MVLAHFRWKSRANFFDAMAGERARRAAHAVFAVVGKAELHDLTKKK